MIPRHVDELFRDFRLETFTRTTFEADVWLGQLSERALASRLWCDGLELEDALVRGGARLDREDVRVVRQGALRDSGLLARGRSAPLVEADEGALEEVVRDGHTLAITLGHRRGAMGAVVALVEDAFRCSSHAVVYVTPPAARGFDLHHDEDDVFVIQLHGSKTWRWAPPQHHERLPLTPGRHETAGEHVRTRCLRVGDVLYLPRGTIHAAETTDEASVHLTMSLALERVFQRDLRACVDALGERVDQPLVLGDWDDPAAENGLVTELLDALAGLELGDGSSPATATPTRRHWLSRALRGAER